LLDEKTNDEIYFRYLPSSQKFHAPAIVLLIGELLIVEPSENLQTIVGAPPINVAVPATACPGLTFHFQMGTLILPVIPHLEKFLTDESMICATKKEDHRQPH
jgi:hypothetical protein